MERTVAEYFAGIGLVRMGVQADGWQVVFANDCSAQKWAMYRAFFPDPVPPYVVCPIADLDPRTIPPTTLATCSFPCTDLSLAGERRGLAHGAHSRAVWDMLRIVHAQGRDAPPILLLENVPGWVTVHGGRAFRSVVQALNALGYACDVAALDARSFTPQSRMRAFVIGTRRDPDDHALARILARPPSLLPAWLADGDGDVPVSGRLTAICAGMPMHSPRRRPAAATSHP